MKVPRVSVVMPCRDGGETLDEALLSIRGQSWQDWELIVVDDGSQDASLAAARAHARQDRRIRVVALPAVGLVEALRRGCAEARGELLARMDADDVSHPERLARQVALMDERPEVALCGAGVENLGTHIGRGRREYAEWINGLVAHEQMAREIFVECPIAHPTFMMRRGALEQAGGYQDRGWAEDYDLVLRFYFLGMRFGKVAQPLLAWRERDERLSRTDARYSPASFRACKRHYLFRSCLQGDRPFVQWGAGQVGKRWLREWPSGRGPLAVIDVDRRKIGQRIHGVQVVAPEQAPLEGKTFVLAAVGAPGARQQIRAWLGARGWRETLDFVFVA